MVMGWTTTVSWWRSVAICTHELMRRASIWRRVYNTRWRKAWYGRGQGVHATATAGTASTNWVGRISSGHSVRLRQDVWFASDSCPKRNEQQRGVSGCLLNAWRPQHSQYRYPIPYPALLTFERLIKVRSFSGYTSFTANS